MYGSSSSDEGVDIFAYCVIEGEVVIFGMWIFAEFLKGAAGFDALDNSEA